MASRYGRKMGIGQGLQSTGTMFMNLANLLLTQGFKEMDIKKQATVLGNLLSDMDKGMEGSESLITPMEMRQKMFQLFKPEVVDQFKRNYQFMDQNLGTGNSFQLSPELPTG